MVAACLPAGDAFRKGLPQLPHLREQMAEQARQRSTAARQATHRRRGGISPLRVSTPHELKSCPSTSPTHPGIPEQSLHQKAYLKGCGPVPRLCMKLRRPMLCSDRIATAATPARANGRAGTPAKHCRATGHASPERRNRAPACLHAPYDMSMPYDMSTGGAVGGCMLARR